MTVLVEEAEVLSRNRAFYAAFRQRDLPGMDDLWAREVKVACVHPGWQAIRGREEVMASWQAILTQRNPPQINCHGATASIMGEMALVLCEEHLADGMLVATNIFVREDGEWRICHHQAGPMATAADERDEAEAEDDSDDEQDSSNPLSGRRSSRRYLN
jgi:ketosteroid isomerase-like protein